MVSPPHNTRRPALTRAACVLVAGAVATAACTGSDDDSNTTGETQPDEATTGVLASATTGSAFDRAVAGVGGTDALSAWTSTTVEAGGTTWVTDQGYLPDEDPTTHSGDYVQTSFHDLADDSIRHDYQRAVTYPFAFELDFSEKIVGDLGTLEGWHHQLGNPDEVAPMESDRMASTRRTNVLETPHLLLRSVLDDETKLLESGDESFVVATDGEPVRLHVDADGTILAASSIEAHPTRGDVAVRAHYSDWRPADSGELWFPYNVELTVDGLTVQDETRTGIALDQELGGDVFAFADGVEPEYDEFFADKGYDSALYYQDVSTKGTTYFDGDHSLLRVEELAPGVHYLLGDTYHSMVVEQEDGIVIVEASLYPERSSRMAQWIEATYPDAEIKAVVNTHSHKDHSGSIRSFAADGIDIVISEVAEEYWADLLTRPATIEFGTEADAFEPSLVTVPEDGVLVLDDPERPIEIHHLDSHHAGDNLMVYLPETKTLYQSDVYATGFPAIPNERSIDAFEMRDAIEELGLDVELIAGSHGLSTVTWEQYIDYLDQLESGGIQIGEGGGLPEGLDPTELGIDPNDPSTFPPGFDPTALGIEPDSVGDGPPADGGTPPAAPGGGLPDGFDPADLGIDPNDPSTFPPGFDPDSIGGGSPAGDDPSDAPDGFEPPDLGEGGGLVGPPEVTLIHSIPGSTVDVALLGEVVITDWQYGDTFDLTPYSGQTLSDMEITDSATGEVLIGEGRAIPIPTGGSFSVVAHRNGDGGLQISPFQNAALTDDVTESRLTVRHVADADPVTLSVFGQAVETPIEPGTSTSFTFPVEQISDVQILAADGSVIADLGDLDVEIGHDLILFVGGDAAADDLDVVTQTRTPIDA